MSREIKTLDVLTMLDEGKSRKEIALELELNPKEEKLLFNHPVIKGVRASKHKIGITIVDDSQPIDIN